MFDEVFSFHMLDVYTFAGDADNSSLDPEYEDLAQICCDLLGIELSEFCIRTTTRKIEAEGKEMRVHLSRDQAFDSRDALAKDIYDKLFLWLVSVINGSTAAPSAALQTLSVSTGQRGITPSTALPSQDRLISLLDIFGFESFRINRFEQFCINYANEKLQQKFTQDVFQAVQQEYKDEGLEWESIGYKDNAVRLIYTV
jgi:myosin-5